MIFSWSSHIAPLENNDIHVHLQTLHFQSFRTQVISHNVGHFVLYSSGRRPDVDQRSLIEVDLSGVRLSVRPSVRLTVCLTVCLSVYLSVNMFIDGQDFFRYLHNFTLKGTF